MVVRNLAIALSVATLVGCSPAAKYENIEPFDVSEVVVLEPTTIALETEPTKSIYEIKEMELKLALDGIQHIENKLTWFIEYKKLIEEFSPWINAPETIYDVYSAEDIKYMLKCIETETYQQNFIPKVNVASVILNRVESERFPSKPIDVVTSPKQFAYFRENVADDTILALEYAYMMGDTTDGALFFHSFKTAKPTFSNANYMFTDEAGHHFYK